MITMEMGKLDGAIRLDLFIGATPVTGLTSGDLTIKYFVADGTVSTMLGFDLLELGVEFPGVYLLTTYAEDLVAHAGPAGLKVTGAFDTLMLEIDVSESQQFTRKLYQLGYFNLIWDSENSLWQLKDETDTLLGTFPAQDVNGNPA